MTTLRFPDVRISARDATKLRGYFGERFRDRNVLFHHHLPNGKLLHRYALIQYKVVGGVPTVTGIADGARALLSVFLDIEELVIGETIHSVEAKEIDRSVVSAGIGETLVDYRFAAPYYALNQKNYRTHRKLVDSDRPAHLDQMLRGHLRALLKGVGFLKVEELPILTRGRLTRRMVNYDDRRMQMYGGGFTTNVIIPPLLGIGKSTSAGFGTISKY